MKGMSSSGCAAPNKQWMAATMIVFVPGGPREAPKGEGILVTT